MKVSSLEITAAAGSGTLAASDFSSGACRKAGRRTSQKSIALPCSP